MMLAGHLRELLGKGMLVIAVAGLVIATAPVETAAAAAYGDNQTYITVGVDEGGNTTPPPTTTKKGGTGTTGVGDDDG